MDVTIMGYFSFESTHNSYILLTHRGFYIILLTPIKLSIINVLVL